MSTDSTTSTATAGLNNYYLSGWPNVTSSGATARGYLRITYVIDFYSPCPTQGISFVSRLFNKLTVDEKRELLAQSGDDNHSTRSSRKEWDVVSSTSRK